MRHLGWLGLLLLTLTGCGDARQTKSDKEQTKSDKESVVELEGLKSRVPDTWKAELPANKDALTGLHAFAQFRLSDETVVIVYSASVGNTPPIKAAAEMFARWSSQFPKKEGDSGSEGFDVGHLYMAVWDTRGTWREYDLANLSAPPKDRPNYRFIAVHISGKQESYHIVLRGPSSDVQQHKTGFDKWLKGFQ